MIKEKWLKHIFAGVASLVALIVYMMTMAPTVSFWDCGEFVACANTLGIPHPPGTPFFVFLARAVIVLLPFVGEIAKRVNYISVVSSAATVYLTALFAWELLSTILKSDSLAEKISEKVRTIVLGTSALVAGFLLTFSDTFWFNAVEAEVYGIAMFILMLISYLGLIWYNKREEEGSDRLLIFICYIAFLGVGAHLYTMLTVPAVFVLLLVAQPKKIVERIPVWITGTLLCSVIYMVSAFIELSLGCLIVLAILTAAKPFRPNVNKAVRLSLAFSFFALIGYSTHLYIPIRSELNPIIDENNPEINIRDDCSPGARLPEHELRWLPDGPVPALQGGWRELCQRCLHLRCFRKRTARTLWHQVPHADELHGRCDSPAAPDIPHHERPFGDGMRLRNQA